MNDPRFSDNSIEKRWTRVGVLNSFLRLSNTPTLVLWGRALIFQAFSFLMHSSVIHIVKGSVKSFAQIGLQPLA